MKEPVKEESVMEESVKEESVMDGSGYRIAIVGTGPWACRYFETINRLGGEVVAYTRGKDIPVGADHPFASTTWMPRESFYDWCNESTEVDGVIVAADPTANPEALEKVAYLPMLIEKPLALRANLINIALEARNHNTFAPVMGGYVHLWSHAFRTLLKNCPSEEIVAISSVGGNAGPQRSWSTLLDYGSHDLSMIISLLHDRQSDLKIERATRDMNQNGTVYYVQGRIDNVIVTFTVGNGMATKQRGLNVRLRDGSEWSYDDLRPPAEKVWAKRPLPLFSSFDVNIIPVDEEPALDVMVKGFFALINDWPIEDLHPDSINQNLRFGFQIATILEEVERRSSV